MGWVLNQTDYIIFIFLFGTCQYNKLNELKYSYSLVGVVADEHKLQQSPDQHIENTHEHATCLLRKYAKFA